MPDDRFIWDEERIIMSENDTNTSIDLSEIPEITDISKGRKNPFAGRFKDGYTIIVEHQDHDEVITVKKTRRAKIGASNEHQPSGSAVQS